MPDYEFPAGLWVLRQIEKEAKIQGTAVTAHDKWLLKQPLQENSTQSELVKRTVILIRSSITRAKTNSQTLLVTINPELTIPQDWFEGYKNIYVSGETSILGDCLQKAFKGCPELGETTPWMSPEFNSDAPRATNQAEEANYKTTNTNASPAQPSTKGSASIVLGAISIFIALIGGAALAIPFGIYGINSARKAISVNQDSPSNSIPQIGLWLSIAGISIALILFIVRITQS